MNAQDSRKLLRERITREQVGHISAEFKHQRGITLEVASTPGGAAYLYAAGQLLVRADQLQQVQRVLGEDIDSGEVEDVIDGVKLIHLKAAGPYLPLPSLPVQVARIGEALGERTAALNYVLTVAPEAGPCPATEPEEVYFDIEPSPGVRMEGDGSDGSGVRIYIADTGLLSDASSHSWLAGVRGDPDPLEPRPGEIIQPYAGHGAFVAGAERCMAPASDVFVSNAFRVAGSALESDFVKDLTAALGHGVDIFHLSVTTPTTEPLDLLGFQAWLDLLGQYPGVVCVVAAGNDGSDEQYWPAAYPGMVSVGALTADGRNRASFSNYGDWVKVYAPGRDLINAYATGTYECKDAPYTGQLREFYGMAKWSGTSFSTPLVTGLIAARMSRTGQNARQAADDLLKDAQSQAIPGVGPILLPYGNQFQI